MIDRRLHGLLCFLALSVQLTGQQMTVISVTLIRGTHSDFTLDDVEALKVLRLNNHEIDCIDNLEVFSHIEELHLANNIIERIENVDFLDRLNLLDLSDNLISSASLKSSVGLLPRNIKTLVLTGNPCATDKVALSVLQRSYAGLNLIVNRNSSAPDDVDEASDEGDEVSDKEQIDGAGLSEADDKFDEIDDSDFPLNADEVLQSLVERKCRLQSMETFNVTQITEVRCTYSVIDTAYHILLCHHSSAYEWTLCLTIDSIL